MVIPIRSSEGQLKSKGGFGANSYVPFVIKECKYINYDTLELDIWTLDHYIDTYDFILWAKNTKPMPSFPLLAVGSGIGCHCHSLVS